MEVRGRARVDGIAQVSAAKNNVMPRRIDGRTSMVERQREADRLAKLHAPLVRTPPLRRAHLLSLLREAPGAGADTQADRVLRALLRGPATTHELRQHLDIASPAARIFVLRQRGHHIATRWVSQASFAGKLHRWVEYSLIRGGN
jgi:hypothetical protein